MEWDEAALEKAYEAMMEIAREARDSEWKLGEVLVLETWPGQYHWVKIPDLDPAVREPVEEELIQSLMDWESTRVLSCLCTMNGAHPDIPSWHLRSRLVEIDPENLNTITFLWGGGDTVLAKPFSSLLPPKKDAPEVIEKK